MSEVKLRCQTCGHEQMVPEVDLHPASPVVIKCPECRTIGRGYFDVLIIEDMPLEEPKDCGGPYRAEDALADLLAHVPAESQELVANSIRSAYENIHALMTFSQIRGAKRASAYFSTMLEMVLSKLMDWPGCL